MYKVTMSKVKGGERVRTDSVTGFCQDYPIIGESFEVIAESLAFKDGVRLVTTSPVKDITGEGETLIIETLNSTYQVTIKE